MKLRMQFGLPAELQSWRRSDREPARQRAMRGNEKGPDPILLERRNAARGVERAKK